MNRRAFLSGAVAAAAAGLPLIAASGAARAQDAPRFSRIVVDTRPLEARGGGGSAAIVRQQLQESLRRELAGRIGGRGPVLTVRIHTVLLGSGMPGYGRRGGGGTSDYLEGEVIAGTQRFPLLVTQDSSTAGAWYLPDFDERRLRALAVQFAGWTRRKV